MRQSPVGSARKVGRDVGHLKRGEVCCVRFDMSTARNREMDRRRGRRPRHPHKVHHLEIELLHDRVDANRRMRVVGHGYFEIDRLVLELRARHRQHDLFAMHRERRALNDNRRAQKVEFHVAFGQRQLALGRHAAGNGGIAVDHHFAADGPAHAEVGRIDQQRQPSFRREVVKSQRDIVEHNAGLRQIHRAVEGRVATGRGRASRGRT